MLKLISLFLVFGVIAFGDASIVVPEGDPLAALLNLVMNWSSIAPLVKASAIIMVAVQAFKKFVPTFQYLKVVVVIGGVIYGFIQSMMTGMSLANAAVFVLLTSGGAVAIYELLKTPLNAVAGIKKK